MQYSLWKDKTGKDMQEIIKNVLSFKDWHISEKDPYDNSELIFNVASKLENKVLSLLGTEISYCVLDYEIESLNSREAKNEIRASRIKTQAGCVIVFTDGLTTKFIINKSYSASLKYLRKINNYTGQKEIVKQKFSINPDLFFWVFRKVADFPGAKLGEKENILLESVTGFKGQTNDKLAEIVGSGDRILNLISTLTFLLESDNLSRIEMLLDHGGETYALTLGKNDFIDINTAAYLGEKTFLSDEESTPLIVLSVFLVIIPDLLQIYDQEIEDELWSNEVKRDFLTEKGQLIQKRIQEKLESLGQSDNLTVAVTK